MLFCKLVLFLSLAYASSAYNYYYNVRPLQASGYNYASQDFNQLPPTSSFSQSSSLKVLPPKIEVPATRELTTEENPCTAEILRMPEVQAFKDPLSIYSYIICTDIDIFERMPCSPGTFFETTIRHCVPEGWKPPVCPVGLCKNQADCIIDEIKNEYKCLCRTGYTGLFCEINIDECALEGNKECGSGKCIDQLNGYYCLYEDNKIGVSYKYDHIRMPCTIEDLAEEKQFFEIPSELGNVFLQCTGELTFLVSRCAEMLFWNQELKTCSIERPLVKTGICKTFPCKNDGECVDLGNNQFQCVCKEGYTGSLCETIIDHCISRPCQNGGRCVSHPRGYNCVCQNKVVDDSCSSNVVNPCKASNQYLPYPLSNKKYFSCGVEGFAFVKDCALGTTWDNGLLTCYGQQGIKISKAPKKSIFDRLDNTIQPPTLVAPPMTVSQNEVKQETSYGSYGSKTVQPPTLVAPPMTVSQNEVKQETSYGSNIVQQPPTLVAPPMTVSRNEVKQETSYGSYGSKTVQQPTPVIPMIQTPVLPMIQTPVQQSTPVVPIVQGQTYKNFIPAKSSSIQRQKMY